MTAFLPRLASVRESPALRIPILVVAFALLDRWLFSVSRLPVEAYASWSIVGQLALRPGVLVLLLVAAAGTARFAALRAGWSSLQHGAWLRAFVGLAAFCLAWKFSTYSYNFYFDRSHALDRMLLWVFFGLLLWRPMFTLGFVLVLYPIVWQFDQPLGTYMWTIPRMSARILLIFLITWVSLAARGVRRADDFVFLTCCLVAANYWWPGLGKLEIDWITHGHLHFITPGAYAQGWLSHVSPESIVSLTHWLERLDWPMRYGTFALEVGALFFVLRHRAALWFLAGWIVFHLAVLATIGFCFWEWILLDAFLLALLWGRGRTPRFAVFTPTHAILSVVLILGTPRVFPQDTQLAWFDTRLYYAYRYEAVGRSGQTYAWPAWRFAPYSDRFTMGLFNLAPSGSPLTGPYGVTKKRQVADALLATREPAEVAGLEASARAEGLLGSGSNEAWLSRFDAFVAEFVRNANHRQGDRGWWFALAPPPTLLASVPGNIYRGQEPIEKIVVRRSMSFYDDVSYRVVETPVVREIDVDGSAQILEDGGA